MRIASMITGTMVMALFMDIVICISYKDPYLYSAEHIMRRQDPPEKTVTLGKVESRRKRGTLNMDGLIQ